MAGGVWQGEWLSSGCSGASWRAAVARAAPSMAGACCGRPLAAVADLTAALWGSRGGLERSGEWMRTAVALQVSKGQGPDAATRAHARAKRALWARPEHARYVLGNMPRHARVLERGWKITGLG